MVDTTDTPEPAGETRPEPVVNEGRIAAAVGGAVVSVVGLVLLIVRGQASDLSVLQVALEGTLTAIMAAAAVVAPIWRARKARGKVTPLADPRTASGTPLVPAPAAKVLVSEDDLGIQAVGELEPHVDTRTPGYPAHAAPEEPAP